MKKLLCILLTAILAFATISAFAATDWPTKPIELIVPANPGGDTDVNARAFAQCLEKVLGVSVVVTNMAGGSGALAFQDCLDSGTDGYRFVFYHSGACITQLMGMYDFDVLEAFDLMGMPVMDETNAFVISTKAEYQSIPELVEYMKAHPGEVSFATETGSFTHLHVLAFEQAADVMFNIVDAGTASEKTAALLGGRLDVIGTQYGLIKDYVATGDFNCIGILAADRLANCPEVPTFKEYGYDIVFNKFFYVATPAGTDAEIIAKFNEACKTVSESDDYKALCAQSLVSPNYMTPEESEAYFADQLKVYEGYLADYIG